MLAAISREPFHPVPLERQHIEVLDLPAGEVELGGVTVAHRRQKRHSAPTLGFRFADALTWITDTAYDPDSGPFAEGSEAARARGLVHQLTRRATRTSIRPRRRPRGWPNGLGSTGSR